MSESVFDNLNTEQVPNSPSPEGKPQTQPSGNSVESVVPDSLFADQLQQIRTNDGRQKYADVKTALDSIPHAQAHILELSNRVKELEEQLTKSKGMDEVLQRIQASQSESATPSVSGLSEAHVMELLNSALNQREVQSKAASNEAAVTKALVDKFGDPKKAADALVGKADELGVDINFLRSLAQKSPKAVLSYFGTGPTPTPRVTTPSVNTSFIQPPTGSDPLADARAKLFGQNDPLKEKWRAAALTNQ